ncbi:SDR family NAD(P)-dependent oxidoreductase [Rhodococcus triatomae]|nr:short-chain dehydrogenase/reductase SDR [Rhodococcus triatomae BKS 15-14]
MTGRLTDGVVLVFGAGSSGDGLSNGEAAARTYAAEGARVVAIDRDGAEAERVAKEITAAGGEALAVRADVTVEDEVARAVAESVSTFGRPTVLHHNVGVPVDGSVLDLTREQWDASVAVNLTGVFLTTRHVLPHLLDAGRGAIVTVSSVAAIRDTGYVYPAYNATKAAVNQLTVSLALTYADQGIRANAVLPGMIDTPLVAARDRAARDAASPTGRVGSPWDVARAAAFLASDDAAYVNGVCLPVDGGLSARCL